MLDVAGGSGVAFFAARAGDDGASGNGNVEEGSGTSVHVDSEHCIL